jgi:glycosyltransferase involved in cell wall biosynthesis
MEERILRYVESRYAWTFRETPFVTESLQSVQDLEGLGIAPERVRRIPPGVDLELFRPRAKAPVPTLFYFGGFKDYKRPWLALEVLSRVLKEQGDAQLVLAGDGPNLERVKRLARGSLKSKVTFLGRVSEADLSKLLAEAWVHIYTSSAEGWGYCVMEAAAAGTPTVAFSVPGPREVVVPGVNGELVPDQDIESMGKACSTLLSNPGELPERSRAYAEGFTWSKAAEAWEKHLAQVEGTPCV